MSQCDELADLIHACAREDRQAFARLYDLTAARLLAVSLGVLGNRALAEDALQEGYVAVWRYARSFDSRKGSGMTWLISIVRNQSLTLRRRLRPEVSYDDEIGVNDRVDPNPDPEDQAFWSGEARTLMSCLEELETTQRKAILLAYGQGYSHGELSQKLDVPLGTVKSWIRRGLTRLQRCFEDGHAA